MSQENVRKRKERGGSHKSEKKGRKSERNGKVEGKQRGWNEH